MLNSSLTLIYLQNGISFCYSLLQENEHVILSVFSSLSLIWAVNVLVVLIWLLLVPLQLPLLLLVWLLSFVYFHFCCSISIRDIWWNLFSLCYDVFFSKYYIFFILVVSYWNWGPLLCCWLLFVAFCLWLCLYFGKKTTLGYLFYGATFGHECAIIVDFIYNEAQMNCWILFVFNRKL